MQLTDELRKNVELIAQNCQGASKALVVIDPFIAEKRFGHLQKHPNTPTVVPIITEKLSRYAIICMARIYDESDRVASLKQTIPLLNKWSQTPTIEEIFAKYKELIECDEVKTVLHWRHDFGAHTSKNPFQEEFEHTYLQLRDFHLRSCEFIDGLYEFAFEESVGLKTKFRWWCEGAKNDWIQMLRPLGVPIPE